MFATETAARIASLREVKDHAPDGLIYSLAAQGIKDLQAQDGTDRVTQEGDWTTAELPAPVHVPVRLAATDDWGLARQLAAANRH